MPFVRVVLFVVILLLLAAAALLWLPFSDEEVPEAINKGSRRLQEEAIELHREGWDALKETRKEINKMSDGLREQSGPLREEISKAGREKRSEKRPGSQRKRSRHSQDRLRGCWTSCRLSLSRTCERYACTCWT